MRTILLNLSVGFLFTAFVCVEAVSAGCPGPSISTPGSTHVCPGDTVILYYYEDSHCDGFTTRWRRNGVIIEDQPAFNWSSSLVVTEPGLYSAGTASITIDYHFPQELEEPYFEEQGGVLQSNHPGFSHQWLLNGVEIPDANGHELNVTEPGDYQLVLSDFYGCNSYSSTRLSLSSHHLAMLNPNPPVLYPIPNNGEFKLRYAFPLGSVGMLELFDMAGRQVDAVHLEGEHDEWQFRYPGLPVGMYSYRLSVDGLTVQHSRMVVTR